MTPVSFPGWTTPPDGNGIELYRDRDMSDWPRDADGAIAIVTLPLDMAGLLAEAR